ncbi:Menaquinol-cytochrome c reductase cytochrome b subunit [Posidoniimonas corsicana]|uniref:Menaquinol-cytochrome c reductase cytochrome b subunit n=1 Tax=Posidoniimonas corsicana TaxID=1938618 RepID=A0A5C5VA11_9BACT|nr:cytochrome b N-terminal domain-containing protein [Posidoniimonas corsicana]TWT35398.1 Menaquinol-cytochrome c reductase cytochrome b subunit [Posidoniimonas corsicana]
MIPLLKKSWDWIDSRLGFTDCILPIIGHTVPRDARWWYVFGSATLTAFIVQVCSGVCLAMAYVPGGDLAYASLRYITEEAPFGSVLRGMHAYGASAMIMLVAIHLAQVYLHAAYKYPRELNWMTGVVLLFAVLGMAFTGQLLRWDANGVWSVFVATEMASRAPIVGPAISHFLLGGETVGGSTLTRFFVYHVFVLPGVVIAGVGLHLFLLFRHGVSEMPDVNQPVDPTTYKPAYEARLRETGVSFWPTAMWRDVVFSAFVGAVIVGCALVFGPPALDAAPSPANVHSNPMPDWYFWWYFAVLSLLPPALEVWFILGVPVLGFLALFCLPLLSNKGHRAPSKRPWAVGIVIAASAGFVVLTAYGYRKPWSPDFDVPELAPSVIGATEGPVFNGAQLVHSKSCLYCHAISGSGGHRGPDLSTIGQQLTRDDLIVRINNGGYNMPAFASSITSAELTQIVDFLMTRTGDQPPVPSPAP